MYELLVQFAQVIGDVTVGEAEWLQNEVEAPEFKEADSDKFLAWCREREIETEDVESWPGFNHQLLDDEFLIYSEGYGNVEMVANFVQRFLKRFRPFGKFAMAWGEVCSKPMAGDFGGGAMFVTASYIKWFNTGDFLDKCWQES